MPCSAGADLLGAQSEGEFALEVFRVRDLKATLKTVVPLPVRKALRLVIKPPAVPPERTKYEEELGYWESYVASQGKAPETEYYRKFMMLMGNISDSTFFNGKVCLDVGCVPKGSLTWLTDARVAIGLDPLAEQYGRFGIASHNMVYLACGAEAMPLVSGTVDVVFSMNSLDHVGDFPKACSEIRRVLKPGGYFIASLNLHEPPTPTEPWELDEEILEKLLFYGWQREYYEVRPRLQAEGPFAPYRYFLEPYPPELMNQDGPQALWCRFRVPERQAAG